MPRRASSEPSSSVGEIVFLLDDLELLVVGMVVFLGAGSGELVRLERFETLER